MPKVAYSAVEREKIREALIVTTLELIAKQGVQHTTVEQIYKVVGISRTFFYSFFPTKEDLIVEALYFQQPKILQYARELMEDPALSWREGVTRFFFACCYGEQHGIAVLTIEEQQLIFCRLSLESCRTFREKQARLFAGLLQCFGIRPTEARTNLFINLSLTAIIVRRAIPQTLPFFVSQAADDTVAFQIQAIVDCLEQMKE